MNKKVEIRADESEFPSFLREKYSCESCLKWSGTESTWMCLDRESGNRVLVKVASDPMAVRCLQNEYEVLRSIAGASAPAARLFSSSIALIGDADEPGRTAFVRSWLPGRTLESVVESQISRPGLPTETAVRILTDVLDQLDFLHHLGPPVIHRDIKPQNVIVDEEGRCHLIDLGVSRTNRGPADSDTLIMGTRLTSPPEQYGYRSTDARSDIYSAGVLLRYCLTGSYDESADMSLPPDLRSIVQKATQFDPKNRYQKVSLFLAELKAAQKPSESRAGGRGISGWVCAVLCLLLFAAGFLLGRFTAPEPGLSVPSDSTESSALADDAAAKSFSGADSVPAGRPVEITEEMFDGDTELFAAYQSEDFLDCSVAVQPDGLHMIRYIEYTDALKPGRPADRTPLSGEELSSYLSALQHSPLWGHGFNLLIVNRKVETLEPFRMKYLSVPICLEFHNCSLPEDPAPLSDLMPYCIELAAYECTPVAWNSLDFLRTANDLNLLDLSFDGTVPVDLSALTAVESLRILRLANADIGREALAAIGRMSGLEILSLPNCGITEVEPFRSLIKLQELNLNQNLIADLSPVESLPSLKSFSAERNPATRGQ